MSSSFEWLELETLSRDIANIEDRLRAARSTKNHGLMRLLEQQLSQAKSRRPIILEAITRHAAHSAAPPTVRAGKHKRPAAVPVEDIPPEDVLAGDTLVEDAAVEEGPVAEALTVTAPQSASDESAERTQAGTAAAAESAADLEDDPEQSSEADLASAVIVPFSVSTEGARSMWNQLTPEHIEHAKRELARRREEILSRHAEELKALETEQDELEALDVAIGVFTRKFSSLAAGSQVVQIEEGQRMRG